MRALIPATLVLLTGCLPELDFVRADAALVDMRPVDMRSPTDMRVPVDEGPLPDLGIDASTPSTAIDLECATEWAELTDATGDCAGRSVTTVAPPTSTLALALARADDGMITIAYNELEGFDRGRIRTVRFDEGDPGGAAQGPTLEPLATIGDVVGTQMAIATEPPDIHHLVYWLRSDFGHEVQLRTLRGVSVGPLQTLATGVGRSGVVDVAVDGDRRVVAAWHDDSTGINAARREQEDESFDGPVTLRTDGDSRIEGAGAIALTAGLDAVVHATYQWGLTLAASAPSYNLGAATWTTPRTLENQAVDSRASGVGADIAAIGPEAIVAYLDWQDGVGEVRLARLSSGSGDPEVEVRIPDVIVADRPGTHPIRIASDAEGLLHLLVADAGGGETLLQYHRQSRIGGETRWLVDTIARLRTTPESVHVDLKIGPDRRPHIAYWSPTLGSVQYATVVP